MLHRIGGHIPPFRGPLGAATHAAGSNRERDVSAVCPISRSPPTSQPPRRNRANLNAVRLLDTAPDPAAPRRPTCLLWFVVRRSLVASCRTSGDERDRCPEAHRVEWGIVGARRTCYPADRIKEVADVHVHGHDHRGNAPRLFLGVLGLRVRRLVVWRRLLALRRRETEHHEVE